MQCRSLQWSTDSHGLPYVLCISHWLNPVMYTCRGYLSTFFRYCKCNGLVYMVFLLPEKSALCVALCSLCVISWSMYDIWTDGFSTLSVGYWCSFTLALGNSRPAFHLLSVCTLLALYRQWLNITAKIRIFPGFQNVQH